MKKFFLLFLLLLPFHSTNAQKLTAEDLVAKHLNSIGTPEARTATKSLVAQGSVIATIRIGGSGQSKGGAVMASQGGMSLLGLIFGTQEYSNEKVAFDGKNLQTGEWKPGIRTKLGGFLMTHDVMFREGLMGGTLSSSWPLLDLSKLKAKLKYTGTKKLDGRQTHVLTYEPARGGNVDIRLFFDAETFQHVRTEYQQDISAPAVTRPEDAARQQDTHLKLTEDFSDFRKEGALTLPHTYKIQLTFDTPKNALLQDWVLTLNQFLLNKELDKSQFTISAN